MGYKQTQLYYYFLKSTYFVKFLFKKQNKKVVNFKDLKEITFIRRDTLLNLEVGFHLTQKQKIKLKIKFLLLLTSVLLIE